MKRINPKRQAQIDNADVFRAQLLLKYKCRCRRCGKYPDWRGIALHHKRLKGMGGTSHLYTIDEVEILCGRCHSSEHHIKEV